MAIAVAVVGAGTWGRALAAAAARASGRALLYSRRTELSAPEGVEVTSEMKRVAERARLVVLAVPSAVAREVARSLGDVIDGRHLVVHGVRGLADRELHTISDIVRQETPARRLGALGGPVLAEDLLAGKPSVMVVGSNFPEVNDAVTEAFAGPTLRVYRTTDLRGLEWASALVGCLVIGIGAAKEAGTSAGLVAAVIARGIDEAAGIAAAAGGDEKTLLGLAGYGDLLASVEQEHRPEVICGRALARGKRIEEASREAGMRVEALELVPRVVEWAKKRGCSVPILHALSRAMFGEADLRQIIGELMTTPFSA
jgi:glycerol-3-phosphate dehydrogenase (NAD(P)+)